MKNLIVRVEVYRREGREWKLFRSYTMNHDHPAQRRVLGEQCRNAFEAGQKIVTYPEVMA